MAVSGRGLLCALQGTAAAAAHFPSKRSYPVATFKHVAGSEVMLIRRWLAKGETAAPSGTASRHGWASSGTPGEARAHGHEVSGPAAQAGRLDCGPPGQQNGGRGCSG